MSMFARLVLVVTLALAGPAFADDDAAQPPTSERLTQLVNALSASPHFKVRATAAVALGRLADPLAASSLSDALRSDEHYAVRVAAASALGRLPTSAGVPSLLVALHDPEPFVRDEAQGALDRFHTVADVAAFRDALQSEDPVARLAAVRAFGEVLRTTSTVAALVVEALGDDSDEVARVAENALAGIPHDRAVPVLIGALTSGGSQVRATCARLLSRRADKGAVEPLIALMTSTDEGEEVRRTARDALRAHKEYLDVPSRILAARDAAPAMRDARIVSLRVLAALSEPGASDVIVNQLIDDAIKDTDAIVRIGGARAASDLGGDRAKRLLAAARAAEPDERTRRQLDLLLKSTR